MKKLLLTFLIAFITALGANAKTATLTLDGYSERGTIISSLSLANGDIKISVTKNSDGNGVKYYPANKNEEAAFRLYANASMKFTCNNTNEKITKIEFTMSTSNGTWKDKSSSTPTGFNKSTNTWESTEGAQTVTITNGGSSGNTRFTKVVITYGSEGPAVLGEIKMGSTPVSTDKTKPTATTVKGLGTISFTSENAASMNVYTLSDNVLAASSGEGSVTWTAPAATDEEQVIDLKVVSQLQNEGEELQKKEAFVTVTVEKRPDPSDDFVLITDANDLSTEYTYILYGCNDSRGKQALMNSSVSSGYFAANQTQSTFNISDDFSSIHIDEANTETAIITLEESTNSGKYYLKIGNKYISVSGTNASLSTTKTEFTITFDTKNRAELKVGSNYLGYNASTPRFKPYDGNANRLGSIYLYAKKTMTPVEPGKVTSEPAAVEGVITVTKGQSITFTSDKAAKLKIEFVSQASKNETVKGNTYTYAADAEDIITITPLDILDTEYDTKAGIFEIAFSAPEAVIATPAAENGTITVNKGTEIKFTSKNAAKLKVEFMEADAITVDGDTYTYKADAEDILTITPIGYNGNEATDKMAEFTVVFPTPEAIVVTPAPENGTIFIQKGETITVTSANADHLNYEIDSESGATAAGVNSWTYTADKDVTIMVTPVGQNGVIYDGKNETGHSNTDLSVIFSVDVDLSLGEITFSPAAGAVYANTEVEISCRNAESLSYTITVGETTSESVSVTGNTAKVNIAEACTVNVTANGENETSKTASAAYTIKESAGITHTLSAAKDQVTFTCEGADKIKVVTYEIDGSSTEETTIGSSATVNCSSMYAVFDVEGLKVEGENETSIGEASFNLLSELNATITNKGEAWYRVNSISELQENVDYIIVSHFPQENATVEDVYMTNAFKYNSTSKKGQLGYGELNEGELIDNDAVLTLAGAEAHSDAAIFNLVSDGNGKWALKIKNVKINGAEPAVKFLTASQAGDNSVNLRDEAKAEDYTSVYAGPGTVGYPARMGALRFDFEGSNANSIYLRFNAAVRTTGEPDETQTMFRCYKTGSGDDHTRPLYLYGKLEQAPAEVPDYTAMVMYNDMTSTQEMGKLSVEGEEMDLMCHYNKLVGHNGGAISVKIIGFDGQAKILYPKERTAQSAYNKVKPNTASGSLTMAAATHYDLAVDGATTTVPADLKDHYYEIEVQPFNWTDIAAFNIPTAIEDIDVENGEAIEEEGDARYFNLQGLEVKNPGEGIYIRVANGKATKILKK